MAARPRILIIAGPNGAGKTTFATEFLPNEADCRAFVNADLIAAGLSPFRPSAVAFRAGRLMIETIREYAAGDRSFAFETTLSGRGHARSIPLWRARGFLVKLFFLRLSMPEIAISRVRQRVLEGGHDVPEAIIRRRFHAGWRNYEQIYRGLVDMGRLRQYRDSPGSAGGGNEQMKLVKSEDEKSAAFARSPDLAGAEAAMHRAARVARRRAARHGGAVAVCENGRIVWVKVDSHMNQNPGWDAKVIAEIAHRIFGGYKEMFESHGWPERGSEMMRKVQTRVVETYGSVSAFRDRYCR